MIMENYCNNYSRGFKSTINCNKYPSRTTTQNLPNQFLDCLINPGFQRVNKLFVLAFNAIDNTTKLSRYYLPFAKVEDYVVVDGKNVFD